jgi:hypothetical protein
MQIWIGLQTTLQINEIVNSCLNKYMIGTYTSIGILWKVWYIIHIFLIYNEIVMRFTRLIHFLEKYWKHNLFVPRCNLPTDADRWGRGARRLPGMAHFQPTASLLYFIFFIFSFSPPLGPNCQYHISQSVSNASGSWLSSIQADAKGCTETMRRRPGQYNRATST